MIQAVTFYPLVEGHLTFPKGHLTIPKSSQRLAREASYTCWDFQSGTPFLGRWSEGCLWSPKINLPILTIINPCDTFWTNWDLFLSLCFQFCQGPLWNVKMQPFRYSYLGLFTPTVSRKNAKGSPKMGTFQASLMGACSKYISATLVWSTY